MIRVISTQPQTAYNNRQYRPPVKYYNNNVVTKEEIKEDFGIILDREIQKLKVNRVI